MTFASLLRALPVLLVLATPAMAQQAQSGVQFNLFEFEGAYVDRIYNFDEAYTAKHGIPVPTPFSISVPIRKDVKMIADGKPEGGAFAKFTFAIENADKLVLLENIQIIRGAFPIPTDTEDPEALRLQIAANVLKEQVFPSAVQGFQSPQILALEKYKFDHSSGVQLVGRYVDPTIGPMLLRLTVNLHPNQPESYFTVANINLAFVPVSDGETLRQTISGRVANSLSYP
ncbi:hypothetical protein SAMN05444000_11539 [Shimia gijangensis]|uniref:DUF2987 domain-containing protein n=1 Tax=Shimia gijangensis TaxID=1470563 RepID=A0A1M6N4B2_9RHOB|nr:hypothetical protein [Shimia gijangensis]SHJ90544.1 hypothetical protein SAMN05444000_11539 [Shimia gijangensis]